ESDAIGGSVAPVEPRLPSINPLRAIRISFGLRIFAPGHATDEPGAVAQLLMDALEQSRHAVLARPPPAMPNASVDAGVHVANHIRLHPRLLLVVVSPVRLILTRRRPPRRARLAQGMGRRRLGFRSTAACFDHPTVVETTGTRRVPEPHPCRKRRSASRV